MEWIRGVKIIQNPVGDNPNYEPEFKDSIAGIAEAKSFQEFSILAHELFTVLEKTYMKCQKPGMLKMINAIGLRGSKCLLQAGAFNSLWEKLESTFQDERLRQLFGRYATYCGSSPWEAPSTLMLIWDVEMQGVWSVEGGVINLARALKKLAIKKGVNIYKNYYINGKECLDKCPSNYYTGNDH